MSNHLRESVNPFFLKVGFNCDAIDVEQLSRDFAEEMRKGLEGKEGSLMMIPTYIGMNEEPAINKPVIVLDAGGSNFRVSVVHLNEKHEPVIEKFQNYTMPGTTGEISSEEFFSRMAECVLPVIDDSDTIAFCFSYAAQPLANKDARVVSLAKELRVTDLVGQNLGERLNKALAKVSTAGAKKIIVLNDSVSTLLGGKAASTRSFDSYIGFILGTGTNTCYCEQNKNITKISGSDEGSMLINTESGSYSVFPISEVDKEFDSKLKDPGKYLFEKTIAGKYQGDLSLAYLKKAAEEGLFSSGTAERILNTQTVSSAEIDAFLFYPYGDNKLANCCGEGDEAEHDRLTVYAVIDTIFERAAKFVAANIAGVMLQTNAGHNPCRPTCVTADGSTFYYSKLFRSKLDYYVRTVLNDQMGLYCEFLKVDKATLIGTAIAGLMN